LEQLRNLLDKNYTVSSYYYLTS